MKQAKRLTREQKEVVRNNMLNWNEWAFVDDIGSYLKIINKKTGKIKLVDKYRKGEKR